MNCKLKASSDRMTREDQCVRLASRDLQLVRIWINEEKSTNQRGDESLENWPLSYSDYAWWNQERWLINARATVTPKDSFEKPS
ncbi:hypothetical protein DBV39_03885 [Orrella marina]|uniref:Uncharacterized protein n=1 Tax=Orrella marina TaxID=2163011 RepID=A0A2R4XH12_9BURK|nr:hypothetical protein DBV39_03885 [Orrella marina]